MCGDAEDSDEIDPDYLDDLSRLEEFEGSQDPADWMLNAKRADERRRAFDREAAKRRDDEIRRRQQYSDRLRRERLATPTAALLRAQLLNVIASKDPAASEGARRALELLHGFEGLSQRDKSERLEALLTLFIRHRVKIGDEGWASAHVTCVRMRAAHREQRRGPDAT